MKLSILSLAISLGAAFAQTEVIYTTQRGFVFTQVNDEKFGQTWKAPNGLIWSQYQGNFSNFGNVQTSVATFPDFVVNDSHAELACVKIGGKLPTLKQSKIFFKYFSNGKDFTTIFPPAADAGGAIWTSNSVLDDGVFTRFVRPADPYGDAVDSTLKLAVWCVHE